VGVRRRGIVRLSFQDLAAKLPIMDGHEIVDLYVKRDELGVIEIVVDGPLMPLAYDGALLMRVDRKDETR
jgi:hypothetical protein